MSLEDCLGCYFLPMVIGGIILLVFSIHDYTQESFDFKHFLKWFVRILFWPVTLLGFIGYGIYLNAKE